MVGRHQRHRDTLAMTTHPRRISTLVSTSTLGSTPALAIAFGLAFAFAFAGAVAPDGAVLMQVRPAVGREFVWTGLTKIEAVNAVGELQMDVLLTQRVLARTDSDLTWSMKTTFTQLAAKGAFAGVEEVLKTIEG